jgi:hypothetical protein
MSCRTDSAVCAAARTDDRPGMGIKYELFTRARQVIKVHPDWDDEKVAEHVGAKLAELDIIREARKDAMADQQV